MAKNSGSPQQKKVLRTEQMSEVKRIIDSA
jgi:hypothetical protein